MKNHITEGFSTLKLRKEAFAVANLIFDYLNSKSGQKTIDWKNPQEQLDFWQKDFDSSEKPELTALFKDVMDHSVNLHSPGYMGHQVGVTLPVTVLSNAVIAALSQGMAVYEMGMAGNAMERVITQHLAKKMGFGDDASGVITSGGSLANLTALLTARARFDPHEFQNLVVLVSREAHYSIARAAYIMGLPEENVISIPVNGKYQMQTETLDEVYQGVQAAGKKVLAVVACSCSTALGAYDDLNGIGDWAGRNGVWFHVDGAHGAAVVYSSRYRYLIDGIEKADSVIMDYHKLLMIPSLITAVIYKKGRDAQRTFAQKADYLFTGHTEDDWYNAGKRTVECTRSMNILNVYTVMRLYGEEIFEENVETLYGLSRRFAELIHQDDRFELAADPQSNIVCFRLRDQADPDKLNREMAQKLLEDGQYYIVNTVMDGSFWLRVTIQNPLTSDDDLEQLLNHILSLA